MNYSMKVKFKTIMNHYQGWRIDFNEAVYFAVNGDCPMLMARHLWQIRDLIDNYNRLMSWEQK
jgi:hypothetical protein